MPQKKSARWSITGYLIEKFTGDSSSPEPVTDPDVRTKFAFLEAWVSIIGNFILAFIKVTFGLVLNSISLLADAAHTAADVLTSVVVLVGFRMARAPADEKHPFGHGRVEFLSTLVIAILLLVVGFQFGKSSYERLLSNTPVKGSFVVAAIMVFSGVAKEWMTRFALYLGRKTNAQALIGDAWHHRTDAIASVLVAVAIVSSRYGYHWVDAVLGIGVSALIVYTGVELALSSASTLIGEGAPEELLNAIRTEVLKCEGVKDLHKVIVHDYGGRKSVSLHILVSEDLSLLESHNIATEVEKAVKSRVAGDVVVHMEPFNPEENQGADAE
ncbi:MAG TPA: cation transporter [Firmicutes bacterium]|nr:cation transporter [Candidatus Fermentithermobacillaceae bacterium]